jgi:hypothetical protein
MKPRNDDLLKDLLGKRPTPTMAETHLESTIAHPPISQVPPKDDRFATLKREPKPLKAPRTVHLKPNTLDKLVMIQRSTGQSMAALMERFIEEALQRYF